MSDWRRSTLKSAKLHKAILFLRKRGTEFKREGPNLIVDGKLRLPREVIAVARQLGESL